MSSASSTSNTLPMKLQEQEGGVVSWCDLPSDLYGQILRRITCCKDGVRLSEVCRHWRACGRQHFPRCRALPMRVTRTAHGTHVVHVRGFSWLQEQHLPLCRPSWRFPVVEGDEHQECVAGFVDSPKFTVAGLDWAIRYYPGCDDDRERGSVGVFVRLLTEGAVARAYVGLQVLDQAIGVADDVIWDERGPRLFDTARASADWCLKIECVIRVVSQDGIF